MSLLFNRLSRFVRAFLPRRKCLLISWLLSPSAVLLELKKRKSVTASTFRPSICLEVMRPDPIIFVFWMLRFKPAFPFSFLPVSRGSLVPLHFLPLEWYQLYFWGCWYFPSNLYYSLWFTEPGISHDVLFMEVKLAGWQYTALSFSFPNLEPVPSSMFDSSFCFLTHMQVSQESGKVVWYSHLFKSFPQFLWSTESKALA